MSHDLTFEGAFTLNRPLDPHHRAYLIAFSHSRRMVRNPDHLGLDPLRDEVNLPAGLDGQYYVGRDWDSSIIHHNRPPRGQPSLWCGWIPKEDPTSNEIVWNGIARFTGSVKWIEYLITHFLQLWGYTVNGSVEWEGDDSDDLGTIIVTNNEVSVLTY